MEYTILLNKNINRKEIEEEEKLRFLRSMLEAMDVPLDFWPSDEEFTLEIRVALRSVLNTFNIEVLDEIDGSMTVHVDGEMIANWYKPEYVLKQDLSKVNPINRLFLEMKISFWSLFEETDEQNNNS